MNVSFLMGALVGWMSFTPEGRKFGDKAADKLIKYVQKKMMKENKDDSKGTV